LAIASSVIHVYEHEHKAMKAIVRDLRSELDEDAQRQAWVAEFVDNVQRHAIDGVEDFEM
jgi:hypothetical protein